MYKRQTLSTLLEKYAPVITKFSKRFTKSNPWFFSTIRAFRSTVRRAENLCLNPATRTSVNFAASDPMKVNNRSFRHVSPCLWNQLPKELRLPIDHKGLPLSSDLTHHCHHPFLLLTATPGSKLIFSTDLFLRSSSTFLPTGLFLGRVGFNFGIVCEAKLVPVTF